MTRKLKQREKRINYGKKKTILATEFNSKGNYTIKYLSHNLHHAKIKSQFIKKKTRKNSKNRNN